MPSKSHRIDVRELECRARGRWDEIFSLLAPALAEAIARGRRHGPCPLCGGKDRFRMYNDWEQTGGVHCNQCGPKPSGLQVLAWLAGDTPRAYGDALRRLADHLVGHSVAPVRLARAAPERPVLDAAATIDADRKLLERMARIWDDAVPLGHRDAAFARAYLRNRGLSHRAEYPAALRAHPALDYWDIDSQDRAVKLGTFPAIVAAVMDPLDRAVNIHRTYLTADGQKAPVPEPKKLGKRLELMGVRGGAIRLGAPQTVLHVAEGIESSFAVMEITDDTCWATISSKILAQFRPPAGVAITCFWADKDRNRDGENSAEKAVEALRAEGHSAVVFVPPDPIPDGAKSVDWLDMLNRHGADALRRMEFLRLLRARLDQAVVEPSLRIVRM